MDVSFIFDDLNDAQRQAVSKDPCPMLVLAGAGSGKTRVLTHRIAWLVTALEVSPLSILAVTFTNKAVDEIRGTDLFVFKNTDQDETGWQRFFYLHK